VASFLKLDNELAIYSHELTKYDNLYNIVNYHPRYLLMPVESLTEQISRENFWANIRNYHEHLNPEAQDANAHKVSQWLASNVIRSFHPESIFELGCGAGRNLMYINKEMPDAAIFGIDINKDAVTVACRNIPKYARNIRVSSIYNTNHFADNSIDVVFTSGVLMHIPYKQVSEILKEMFRIARIAVINFELHGPNHDFDYHRYPRDYSILYKSLFPGMQITYEIYSKGDYRTAGTASFNLALGVIRK
jgi:SAM-dependent methyltransferase